MGEEWEEELLDTAEGVWTLLGLPLPCADDGTRFTPNANDGCTCWVV